MKTKTARLSTPATADDLKKEFKKRDKRFDAVDKKFTETDKKFSEIDKKLTTVEHSLRVEIKLSSLNLEQRLEERIRNSDEKSKKYRDDILTGLDRVYGELESIRENRDLAAGQTREVRNGLEDHEQRIARLESTRQAA